MIKSLLAAIFLMVLFFPRMGYSQNNIHFTQFYNAPLILNPALTGRFEDKIRLTGIVRQQWSGAGAVSNDYLFRTPSGSIDISLFNRRLGVGVYLLNDQVGGNIFNVYRGGVSLSYSFIMGDNALTFGAQPIFSMASLDATKLDFGNLPETDFNNNVTYFDVNAGINYKHDFGFFIANIGASVTHLLQPQEKFMKVGTGSRVPMYYRAYAMFNDWEILNKLELHPGIFVGMQSITTNILYGSNISYKLFELFGKPSKIYAGLWGRSNRVNFESAIGLVGLGLGKTTFMASYDYNLNFSTRSQYIANRVNTFEFSVVHTLSPKVKPPLNEDNYILNPRF